MTARTAIVGGGLAGLAAALRLAERGVPVTLYEAAEDLGGKAGAVQTSHGFLDHGFHVFPAWYLNLFRIVDDLGIRGNFLDASDFCQLRLGEYPRIRVLRGVSSVGDLWANVKSDFMPLSHLFLTFYGILDLASRPVERDGAYATMTVDAFLRTRYYRFPGLALQTNRVFGSITAPVHEASARTMSITSRFWTKYTAPIFRILRSNHHDGLIAPIAERIRALGGQIRTAHRLGKVRIERSRVVGLEFRNGTDAREFDQVVLAVPPERLAELVDDELQIDRSLRNVKLLRPRQIGGMHLALNRKIAGLPAAPVALCDSELELYFMDLSTIWKECDTTVLEIGVPNAALLEGLSVERASAEVVDELRRYLPEIREGDIVRATYDSHGESPCLMNTADSWRLRPKTTTRFENLFLAGDYCRTSVDLIGMESAVLSGLLAAEEVRKRAGCERPVEIADPEFPSRWKLVAARAALAPLAWAAKLAAWIARDE